MSSDLMYIRCVGRWYTVGGGCALCQQAFEPILTEYGVDLVVMGELPIALYWFWYGIPVNIHVKCSAMPPEHRSCP